MTDAFEIQQAFRVLEKHAKYSAEVLEDLKARACSPGARRLPTRGATSTSSVSKATSPRRARGMTACRFRWRIASARRQAARERDEARTELADALGALEQERGWRQTYQREFSHAMREVERLKASEAANVERERKLTNALRVSGERCAAAERSRKVLTDQVAALRAWYPSDNAVDVAQGMLPYSGACRSAIRAGLRAAFVRDHLEAGEPCA